MDTNGLFRKNNIFAQKEKKEEQYRNLDNDFGVRNKKVELKDYIFIQILLQMYGDHIIKTISMGHQNQHKKKNPTNNISHLLQKVTSTQMEATVR